VYQINLPSPNILLSSGNDLSDDLSINVFPNPTTDQISLTFILDKPHDYRWTVYNEIGSIVNQSRAKKASIGRINETIDLNGLKAGVYFVSVIIENEVVTKEFIVN
jgi:hypothetical protein